MLLRYRQKYPDLGKIGVCQAQAAISINVFAINANYEGLCQHPNRWRDPEFNQRPSPPTRCSRTPSSTAYETIGDCLIVPTQSWQFAPLHLSDWARFFICPFDASYLAKTEG